VHCLVPSDALNRPAFAIRKISEEHSMLEVINDFLSGKVLIVLIVGLGGYFTIRSRFVQDAHGDLEQERQGEQVDERQHRHGDVGEGKHGAQVLDGTPENQHQHQRAAGIKTPVFDSSQFPDLDLDRKAWPANPVKPEAATSAELNAQVQR
jgi:hypothetical protein